MLSSPTRCLLYNVNILKTIPASCRYTRDIKENIIKRLNAENKYLYGKLLETQKQRRKTVRKDAPEVNTKSLADNDIAYTDKTLENEITNKKTSRQKITKPKVSPPPSEDCDISVCSDILEVPSLQMVESELCNQQPSKKQTKKLKANKYSSDISPPTVVADKNLDKDHEEPLLSDQFMFKSAVQINETNYPLDNPERNDLFTKNSIVENVFNYTFKDAVIKPYIKFPSVSKIIEETMTDKNKLILTKWRQNMVNDLGEHGFLKYNEALKTRGHEFHMAVRNTVLGETADDYSETTLNALKSLSWLLESISNPMAVESIIAHPYLEYKGIPDCVAMFRDLAVVIDWKLSDKPKKDLKDTYDAPVQISAYIGGLNHDPNYKWKVNHGLVAVAYTNGDPCDVFLLAPKHCQIYWRHWLMRIDKYKARSHLHLDHNIDEKALEFM